MTFAACTHAVSESWRQSRCLATCHTTAISQQSTVAHAVMHYITINESVQHGCSSVCWYITLHYIRVSYSDSSTSLLNHYYTRCTELKPETVRKEILLLVKDMSFETVPENSPQRWRWGDVGRQTVPEVASPEMHDRQQWTEVFIRSPAARMTTRDSGG